MTGRRAAAVALLGVLCAVAVGATPAHAQQSSPAPAPGVEFVAALHDALDALPPAPVPPADPRLDRVRAPLRLAADLAHDRTALAPISADLDRDPADVQDARTRLQALIAAVQLPPGSVAEDPHASRGALDDVYRQGQLAGLGHRRSGDDLFSRIGRALLDVLRWLASHLVGSLGLVPTLILVGLILAAVVGYVLLRLQRAGTAGVRRVAPEPAARGVDPDDEWRLATDAAARGDHREAVRHAFRSALLAIAVRGRLAVDAAWTTSELLARARSDADLVAALAPAAASFDRAWYSGRPVTAQDWAVARDRCQALRTLAGRRGVPA